MHGFEVHSNESACIKKVRLGLEQVIYKVIMRIEASPLPLNSCHDHFPRPEVSLLD